MEGAQVEIVDNKTFENGMQLSSDIRTQDPGTYSNAVNVRKGSSVRNDKENIYNIKSNVLIQNTLPAGVNTTLFTLEDIRNSGIIFWNHNSLGFHGIYRYLSQSNTIERILHKQPILNFQLSTRINHADIIFNGDDDLLYWTYGYDETDIPAGKWVQNVTKPGKIVAGEWYYNPPRKINIRKALAYTANAWEFQDNGFSSGNTYFVYPGSTLPSWATIGTAVAVQQNPGFTNPEYNTLATIIGVNNPVPNSILLNIQFKTPTPPEGGFIVPQNIDTYYGITYRVLDAIKYPPLFSPTVVVSTDSSRKKNFFSSKINRFFYRYRYDDNEVSVISPASKVTLPVSDETYTGAPSTLTSLNNRVDITFNTGTEIVKSIDLLMQEGDNPLMIIDTLNKKELGLANNISNNYVFYNDKVKEAVDQADTLRPFDFVPQVSDCEAIIQKNVMSYEEITEGYPNLIPDVFFEVSSENVSYLTALPAQPSVSYLIGQTGTSSSWYYVKNAINIPSYTSYNPGDLLYYTENHWNIVCSYVLVANDLTSQQAFVNAWALMLSKALFPGTTITAYASSFTYTIIGTGQTATLTNSVYAVGNSVYLEYYWGLGINSKIPIAVSNSIGNTLIPQAFRSIPKTTGFKSGANHSFAMVYFDRGARSSAAQRTVKKSIFGKGGAFSTKEFDVYVPFVSESSPGVGQYLQRNVINMSIYHTPPVWATHYQIVYAGNTTCSFFIQMQSNGAITSSGNTTTIPLSLDAYNTAYTNSILSYKYEKGDRCRIISQSLTASSSYIDVEVLGYTAPALTIQNIVNLFPNGNYGFLLEIYRPLIQTGENLYFGMNQEYEIGDAYLPTRFHKGNVQDQGNWNFTGIVNQNGFAALVGVKNYPGTPPSVYIGSTINIVLSDGSTFTTTIHSSGPTLNIIRTNIPYASIAHISGYVASTAPAIIKMKEGDVYIKPRLMLNGTSFTPSPNLNVVEDFNYSDFYASAYYNKGVTPYPYDPTARRAKLPFIRYSKPIFESTMVNGLSSFNYASFVPLTHSYGTINKVVERGFTLKVYQSFKTVSVYIGRTEFQDTGGNNSPVGVSQQTFGTITPAENDYGCVFPGSVVKHNNHIYYFDVNSGAVIRDSTNGPIEISKLGIEIFLKALSKQIMAKGIQNFYCAGGFDEEFDEYVLSIKDTSAINPLPPITLAFNETDNVWCSFYSFHPDVYGISQQKFVSFKDGQMWIHNAGTDYNRFYGGPAAYPLDNAPLSITVVGNNSIGKQKIFTYLAVYSDKNEWECPTQGDISIPSSSKYPLGMQSRLLKNHFRPKSRSFYADFLRDMLTPSGTPPLILNGRRLTGEAIAVVLNNNTKDPLLLYGVSIHSIPVEKT